MILKEVIKDEKYEGDGHLLIERSYGESTDDVEGNYVKTNGHWVLKNVWGEWFDLDMNRNDLAERHNIKLEHAIASVD